MSEWPSARLGDVADLITKGTTPTTYGFDYVESGIRFLRVNNVSDSGGIDLSDCLHIDAKTDAFLKRSQLSTSDVLVSIAGTIGRVAVVGGDVVPANCNQALAIVRVTKALDPLFLVKYLQSHAGKKKLSADSVQLAQANLSLGQIANLTVPLPETPEQHVIAQILDTLDTQIRQTEALIAKLERIKQGLLTDLLTRGIDQNGQLRPTPDQAPHLYKDSPLGRIPREWEMIQVGKVGEVVTGSTPPSIDPTSWGDLIPFFTPADVIGYEPLYRAERFISERGRRYIREVPPGSTLVVCIGSTIGKVGFTSRAGATNQQINAVLPSAGWDDYFVFLAVHRFVNQILAWVGLQAVPIVNKSTFSKMLIPQPALEEQRAISEKLRAVDERIADERSLIAKLSDEKSGLMDDLLIGRVRVTPLLDSTEQADG